MIHHNKDIIGITIENIEYKMTQFADDTTIILDGSHKSLQATLNILEMFGTFSGLRMNKEKTKLVWIGRKKHSRDKLNVIPSLIWGTTEFSLLGLTYTVHLDSIIEINYNRYLPFTTDIKYHKPLE